MLPNSGTIVLGISQFMLYIDIWSPLYVAQPSADSDKSPVPYYNASKLIGNIHQYLCAFSCLCIFICDIMLIGVLSNIVKMLCHRCGKYQFPETYIPASIAKERAFSLVRLVVPKQGIETAVIPLGSNCIASKARTVASNAKVESNPPDRPITT